MRIFSSNYELFYERLFPMPWDWLTSCLKCFSNGPSSTTTTVRSRLLHHQLLAPHLPGHPRPSPPPGASPPPPPPPPPTPSPALAPAKIRRGLSTKNSNSRKHEQSQPPSCFSITVPRLQREAKKMKATFSRKGGLLEQYLLKSVTCPEIEAIFRF